MIPLNWCLSNNIGDALNVYLVKKITGHAPIYVQTHRDTHAKYMVCGSILNHADKDTIVWGAGIAKADDVIDPRCDIRAVRGPLTAERCGRQAGISCKVYGDPALLMPMFYDPDEPKRYDVGVVPHYIHQSQVTEAFPPDCKFINVFDDVETIVSQIKSCNLILSSSLHGIILAHAYGVPAVWFEGMYPLGGDGTKFYDYFLSVGVKASLHKWGNADVKGELPDEKVLKQVTDDLWEACPFK